MLNRTNVGLIVILIVQIILGASLALSSSAAPKVSDEPLLKDFAPENVTDFVLEDDLGKELHFMRSGDTWLLPSADDYPVDASKVDAVLSKLVAFQSNRLIATNPTSQARLEVKDDKFRHKLTLTTDKGEIVIYLGTDGGANTSHTRLEGDDNIYLTSGLNSWELPSQVSSWIDPVYLNVDQGSVTKLILTNASGTYEFDRGDIDWAYKGVGAGEVFDSSKMSNILRNATSVRMTQPLGLEALDNYGIDEAEITIQVFYNKAVETKPADDATPDPTDSNRDATESNTETVEKSYTITIGKALDNSDYVIKADNNDYYVEVRSSFVTTFRNINHQSLLVVQDSASETKSD